MFLASFSWLRSCAAAELETLLGRIACQLTDLLLQHAYAVCRIGVRGHGEALNWVVGALWLRWMSSYGRGYGV